MKNVIEEKGYLSGQAFNEDKSTLPILGGKKKHNKEHFFNRRKRDQDLRQEGIG